MTLTVAAVVGEVHLRAIGGEGHPPWAGAELHGLGDRVDAEVADAHALIAGTGDAASCSDGSARRSGASVAAADPPATASVAAPTTLTSSD